MMARRIRQIIQCAKMQLNAGNLLRANAYYVEAGKLITKQRVANAPTLNALVWWSCKTRLARSAPSMKRLSILQIASS